MEALCAAVREMPGISPPFFWRPLAWDWYFKFRGRPSWRRRRRSRRRACRLKPRGRTGQSSRGGGGPGKLLHTMGRARRRSPFSCDADTNFCLFPPPFPRVSLGERVTHSLPRYDEQADRQQKPEAIQGKVFFSPLPPAHADDVEVLASAVARALVLLLPPHVGVAVYLESKIGLVVRMGFHTAEGESSFPRAIKAAE